MEFCQAVSISLKYEQNKGVRVTFFQRFLNQLDWKLSKSSMTHGLGTKFWEVAKKDKPSLENTSASF